MAGKIKIFELDIDVDAAVKASKNLKDEMSWLDKEMKKIENTAGKNSEVYIKLEAEYKNMRSQYNASQREIGKMLQIQGKEIKTIEQGRNALAITQKEWAKQAALYGTNSKEADALANRTKMLTDRLKELEKGIGDNRRNVGNYADGMKEAISQSSLLSKAQGMLNDVLKVSSLVITQAKKQIKSISDDFKAAKKNAEAYAGSQLLAKNATTYTSAALKLFRVALVSTGIGALIVLIGSLVAWFSKTQKGIDTVNLVLKTMGGIFDTIIDRIAKVGGAMAKLITGDFKGAWNDLQDAAKGFGDELANNTRQTIALERQLQNLNREATLLEFRRAAANRQIDELKTIVDDTTQSTEDRIKASEDLARIEQELADEELENHKQRLANAMGYTEVNEKVLEGLQKLRDGTMEYSELRNSIGLTSSLDGDVDEFLDLFKKVEDAQKKSEQTQRRNLKKQNSLIKEQKRAEEERAQKATEAAIKENKVRLALFIEQNQNTQKGFAEQLKFAEEKRDKEIAILDQELKAKKLSQTEYELEILKIKNKFIEEQANITIENAQKELDAIKDAHQSRIDAGELLTDQLVDQEFNRLDRIAEAEREFQQKRLEEGVISREEYNKAIAQVDEDYRTQKEEIEQEYNQQKAEAEAIDIENQREIEAENLEYDLEKQLEYLERKKQQEIEQAEAIGADTALINQKYALIEQQIKEAVDQNKLQLASQTYGNLSTILGKESAAGKAMAVSQATIDTYQSATAAFKAMAGIPIVGPALGAAAAAAAVVSGLANVKKITATKKPDIPKAEKGALFDIGGKRHHSGGTKFYGEDGTQFEAEKGELIGVMNRRAAMLFKGFNDTYRDSTRSTGNFFEGGGFVQTAPSPMSFQGGVTDKGIDLNEMARLIGQEVGEANRQLPPPVTDVKDVINNVNNYNSVVDGANI